MLKLAGGALALVDNNRATASRSGRIEMVGEKGQLCGDHVHGMLIEIRGGKVRRRGRHFVATDTEERKALALEFCALFAKGLLDKVALGETETGTYLRNHYLNIDAARLPAFQKKLDDAVRKLAEEFAADASPQTRFLNVLVTSTTF